MSKYRFKTEEEFKKDGFWNKDRPFKWVSVMNKYLGKDIPDKYNQACDKQEKFRYDQWHIEPHDYVLKEIQSEYTVGKWYGCKNWSSLVDFVKLERVYDEQAYFTECLHDGKYQKERQNLWRFTTADPLFEADMSIVSPLLPDGHSDKITAEEESLNTLPSEGSFYGTREQLDSFSSFLLSRPNNNADCKTTKAESIGIGWNQNSCWWLKTSFSSKQKYTFEQLSKFIPIAQKEESFVLPSKWCVKVAEPVVETLNQEEDYTGKTIKALVCNPQICGVKLGEEIKILSKESENTYVLDRTARGVSNMCIDAPLNLSDWELLPESPEGMNMEEIQEEVKKRFPIGCKFIPVDDSGTYTLIEDYCTYKISGNFIFAHDCHGSLYGNGKWATLVSLPETTKEMFYEGNYIVTLDVEDDYNCARKNYCFKQRINCTGIAPAIDLKGSTSNSHGIMSFDKKGWLKDWRYATLEEAAEYERIGKPYDVTTLQKKEESIPEYVECLRNLNNATVGKIYKVINHLHCESDDSRVTYCWRNSDYIPSTKEAYEAQKTSKQLTKKDLIEEEIYIYDGSQISTYPEGPCLAINEHHYIPNQKWAWSLSITHATEEQKALLRSCIKKHEKVEPMSQLWLEDPIVEQRINTPSIKKETFIDNVQSVDVILRTKKKTIKF